MTPLGAAVQALAARAGAVAALVAVDGTGPRAQRAAGAHAAIEALAAAGCDGGTVQGHADDGRPLWPDGFTGSISHTDRDAVAVVARSAACRAIGIDIEETAALSASDAYVVLGAEERSAVARHAHPDWLATLLWSAKESAFKAWSTATDGGLGTVDPVDIRVVLSPHGSAQPGGSFSVTAQRTLGSTVAGVGPMRGSFVEADDRVLTLVLAPPVPG